MGGDFVLKDIKGILKVFWRDLKAEISAGRQPSVKPEKKLWEKVFWRTCFFLSIALSLYVVFFFEGPIEGRTTLAGLILIAMYSITEFVWKKMKRK